MATLIHHLLPLIKRDCLFFFTSDYRGHVGAGKMMGQALREHWRTHHMSYAMSHDGQPIERTPAEVARSLHRTSMDCKIKAAVGRKKEDINLDGATIDEP
eukprot:4364589-Prymnesium_polylepis.1